jgi:hypothetical protein
MPAGSAKTKSAEGSGTAVRAEISASVNKNPVLEGEEDLYRGQRDHLEIDEKGLDKDPFSEILVLDNREVVEREILRYFNGRDIPHKKIMALGHAVYNYTGSEDYEGVRKAAKKWINDEGSATSETAKRYFRQFVNIEDFLSKAPKMPDGTVVYRGVGSKRAFDAIQKVPVGGEYHMKSPTSTSTKRNIAEGFMNGNSTRAGDNYKVLMTIKGAAQKTGASIQTLSVTPHQAEVLLSGRTILRKASERIEKNGKTRVLHVEFEYARSDSSYTDLLK